MLNTRIAEQRVLFQLLQVLLKFIFQLFCHFSFISTLTLVEIKCTSCLTLLVLDALVRRGSNP